METGNPGPSSPTDATRGVTGQYGCQVVIVGGGFGGLAVAKSLRGLPVDVTLVDRRNFHLFQPLLYQVATGGLSPANIAAPLRVVLRRQRNTRVLLGHVIDFDPARSCVILRDGELAYDTLVVAAGATDQYFGHDEWRVLAPPLKTLEDAGEMRRRILLAFEAAERESNPARRAEWLTFVVVGGGPTGVELAGTVGELAHRTLRDDFRAIDPRDAKIMLVEGTPRVLETFPAELSVRAEASLNRLGVDVKCDAQVTEIRPEGVSIHFTRSDQVVDIRARTVLWTAGVRASPLGAVLAKATGAPTDRGGRIIVEPDLSVPGHPNVFVIGDLANCCQDGQPLPGVAPVAIQQGAYVGQLIRARLTWKSLPPFHYRNKGNLATIGRAAAVADLGWIRLSGYVAWVVWLLVHLMYLVTFGNRMLVMMQWAWNFFTRARSALLITGQKLDIPLNEAQTDSTGSGPTSGKSSSTIED